MNPQWITALAALVFGGMTATFAFLAYRYTREKFRLDLFDRRWEYFIELWEASQIALTIPPIPRLYGSRSVAALVDRAPADGSDESAEWRELYRRVRKCVSREGRLRAKALFGHEVLKHLDAAAAVLADAERLTEADDEVVRRREFIEMTGKMFAAFEPYLYFGDHRRLGSTVAELFADLGLSRRNDQRPR